MMPTLIPKFNLAERLPSFMSVEVDVDLLASESKPTSPHLANQRWCSPCTNADCKDVHPLRVLPSVV